MRQRRGLQIEENGEADAGGALVAPHLGRLLQHLEGLPGPVIQLWGWPGSGKRALLETVLKVAASGGGGSRPLALAEVESEERLRESLTDPSVAAARWLVALALPGPGVAAACRLLRPGQRLIFAGYRRAVDAAKGSAEPPLPVSWVPPRSLLLRRDEVATLWRQETGQEASGEIRSRLEEITAGWYLPLRQVAEAVRAGPGGRIPDMSELLESPPIVAFLRHEVLAALPEGSAQALGRIAAGGSPAEEPEKVRRELELHGWLTEAGPEGEPECFLPGLLGTFLRQRFSPGRGQRYRGASRGEAQGMADRAAAAPGPSASPEFQVDLLGPPKVSVPPSLAGGAEARGRRDAAFEVRWPLRRALKIFAYLAASEELEASRDDLIAAIWPEGDEETIGKNFHPTLSHLRRALSEAWQQARGSRLPDPLLLINGNYRLNPQIEWRVDVVDLVRRVERGRKLRAGGEPEAALTEWERALARIRGTYLQGIYDAWVSAARERYQRLHFDLLREMGDVCSDLDRFTEALDAYRRVLIEDPLRERVHVALMRVYSRQGRRDLVRRQYDKLAALLAEELGVEPLPETTDEYHRLMA